MQKETHLRLRRHIAQHPHPTRPTSEPIGSIGIFRCQCSRHPTWAVSSLCTRVPLLSFRAPPRDPTHRTTDSATPARQGSALLARVKRCLPRALAKPTPVLAVGAPGTKPRRGRKNTGRAPSPKTINNFYIQRQGLGSGSKRLVCRNRAAGRFSAPRGEITLLFPPRHSYTSTRARRHGEPWGNRQWVRNT